MKAVGTCRSFIKLVCSFLKAWTNSVTNISLNFKVCLFLQKLIVRSLKQSSLSATNELNKQMYRAGLSFFLFRICFIWLCAVNLSLSVFTVALGSSLHPQLMDRVERERGSERRSSQLSLCGAHYTVDFVMVPCWMASTPSYPCPDATREISGLYRTGLSGIPYIHPESVDGRTQIGF